MRRGTSIHHEAVTVQNTPRGRPRGRRWWSATAGVPADEGTIYPLISAQRLRDTGPFSTHRMRNIRSPKRKHHTQPIALRSPNGSAQPTTPPQFTSTTTWCDWSCQTSPVRNQAQRQEHPLQVPGCSNRASGCSPAEGPYQKEPARTVGRTSILCVHQPAEAVAFLPILSCSSGSAPAKWTHHGRQCSSSFSCHWWNDS